MLRIVSIGLYWVRTTPFSTTNASASGFFQFYLCTSCTCRDIRLSIWRRLCCIRTYGPPSLLVQIVFVKWANQLPLALSFFPCQLSCIPMFGLCTTECLTLINAKVTRSLISMSVVHLSNRTVFRFLSIVSVPDIPRIVPSPGVFPSRVVVRVHHHVEDFLFSTKNVLLHLNSCRQVSNTPSSLISQTISNDFG